MQSARVRDLVVVGAGPAGVAAGITAHRAGLDVLVVDKARFPRDKTCGDGLTTAALRGFERLGFDPGGLAGCAPVTETVLVSPSRRHVTLPLPRDGRYAVVVPRTELDAALVAHARGRGVEVAEGAGVDALETGGDAPTTLHLGDGADVRARWIVAADGHYSPTRRLLDAGTVGAEPDLGTWHAVRQYFGGVSDRRLWVVFEPDLLPGYAWVFPLPGGRANVGFGVLRTRGLTGRQLRALWPEVLARPALREALGPDAAPEGAHRAWPIPSAFDASRAAEGPVLFVGDAASVVDPLTGEGIAQAIETGELAADAIARGGARTDVRERYRTTVRRALGADLRFAAALQRLLATSPGARGAIRAAGLTGWTRRNFARWMYEDYPRALVLTPRRWHRGMFTTPGAFRIRTTCVAGGPDGARGDA
jgi:geranylgeranyl reductase family protein